MGFYRLVLAYLVALSHAGLRWDGVDPGIVACISFFMLSGYVMTALIDRHYPALDRVGAFYADRALRLYPQFLLYSLATILAAEAFGLRHPWMTAPPSLASDLMQLTMAPLNLGPSFPRMLMPQAWSLGLEVCFYAAFPFLLIPEKRAPFAFASAGIFALAYCGRLSADWFTYRLLIGNLFVFMLGSWVRRPDPRYGRAPIYGFFIAAGVLLALAETIWPHRSSVSDVLLGIVVGLPIVMGLARLRTGGKAEALAGDLSYGVFLNHNLLITPLQSWLHGPSLALLAVALLPLSTLLSLVTFRLVEAPMIALRRGLRARPVPAPEARDVLQPPSARRTIRA
jgi:peptidoglycan/LPS O-acetylase OafA/YrhL